MTITDRTYVGLFGIAFWSSVFIGAIKAGVLGLIMLPLITMCVFCLLTQNITVVDAKPIRRRPTRTWKCVLLGCIGFGIIAAVVAACHLTSYCA